MARIVRINDLALAVREDRVEQDLEVIRRVIVNDRYRLRVLKARRKRMDVIVDVGGHIGSFGLFAKSLWPEATLIAIEPNAESADLYRKSLDENGFDDDIVLPMALAYSNERRVLIGGNHSTDECVLVTPEEARKITSASTNSPADRMRVVEENVPAITLKQILDRFDLPKIDLMKLDCEGGEFELCRHVSTADAMRVDLLIGEYHAVGAFEQFARDVRRAFPHLYFFGDSLDPVAPFWGVPSLAFMAGCTLSRRIHRASEMLRRFVGGETSAPMFLEDGVLDERRFDSNRRDRNAERERHVAAG